MNTARRMPRGKEPQAMRIRGAHLIRRLGVGTGAASGQIIVLFAFVITGLLGMAALGVDLGHAMERHQFVQGAANNTARVGAFEAYTQAQPSSSQSDAAVVSSMVDTLRQSGLSVANYVAASDALTAFSSLASHGSACPGGLGTSQVYLAAQYIDASGAQIGAVGSHISVPSTTTGVQVTHLALCVPSFFAAVLGRRSFDVGAGDLEGTAQAVDAYLTQPGSPFVSGIAPFYIYGHYCQPLSLACPIMPYTLFAAGAPNAPDAKTQPGIGTSAGFTCYPVQTPNIPCSGDLVTLNNANNGGGRSSSEWDIPQFLSTADGTSNVPTGFPIHDGSNRGCLDPSVGALNAGEWSFNQGGLGHCAAAPPPGALVVIPLIDAVCKDGCAPDPSVQEGVGGTNGSTCQNGGYCVRVVGFVQVYIATNNGGPGGNLTQGYITGVVQDPYCIVQTAKGEHPAVPSNPPFWDTTCPGE